MVYWLLSVFLGFLIWTNLSPHDDAGTQLLDNTLSQRSIQTIGYINTINDWRYNNPALQDGIIPDTVLGWAPVSGLYHVLQANRVFVYQADQPGLMVTLLAQSRQSALIGKVVDRRLIDSLGNDMQISVPGVIADGSLIYLN